MDGWTTSLLIKFLLNLLLSLFNKYDTKITIWTIFMMVLNLQFMNFTSFFGGGGLFWKIIRSSLPKYLPTTVSLKTWLIFGFVETWHSKLPASEALENFNFNVFCPRLNNYWNIFIIDWIFFIMQILNDEAFEGGDYQFILILTEI